MYWEPLSSDNAFALEQLRSFADEMWLGFARFNRAPDGIWGVGFVAGGGEAHPLVLVDSDLVPPEHDQEAIETPEDLLFRFARRRIPELLESGVPIQELILLPPETRVLPVSRPQPLALTSGDPIRDSAAPNPRGTIGLPVDRVDDIGKKRDGFITAGHCARSGLGAAFQAVHARTLLPTTYSPAGKVALHEDPAATPGTAGYDIAVVDLPPGSPAVTGPARSGVARLNGLLPMPEPVDVYGGVSGTVPAELVGAMIAAGDPKIRMWKDSWLVVPSGVTVQGDSGSAIILDQAQDAAGMIVGEARRGRGSRAPLVQFAHDLESLVVNYLTPYNVTLV